MIDNEEWMAKQYLTEEELETFKKLRNKIRQSFESERYATETRFYMLMIGDKYVTRDYELTDNVNHESSHFSYIGGSEIYEEVRDGEGNLDANELKMYLVEVDESGEYTFTETNPKEWPAEDEE